MWLDTGSDAWLVGYNSDSSSIHSAKPDNNVLSVVCHYLVEVSLVHHLQHINRVLRFTRRHLMESNARHHAPGSMNSQQKKFLPHQNITIISSPCKLNLQCKLIWSHCFIPGSKLHFSTNLFHYSLCQHLAGLPSRTILDWTYNFTYLLTYLLNDCQTDNRQTWSIASITASPIPTGQHLRCHDVTLAVIFSSQQISTSVLLGYWHQRADEKHGNPPPR